MKQDYKISKYIRNPEIKRQLFFFILIGAVGGVCNIGFFMHQGVSTKEMPVVDISLLLFLMWGIMGVFHFGESYHRYKRIAEVSSEIDHILHREDIGFIRHMEEGELCILEDEINKMLKRLKEQNMELNREKTYLADSLTDLSHQLRTPLTSMNLLCSMLEDETLTQEKRREYHRKLLGLLKKVQWLIDVLLKISKLDADAVLFEKQSCNIAKLVREAMVPIEIPMELKGLKLVWDVDADAAFLGDRKWMTEAVENILKNCMEHTPAGGTITVSGRENTLYTELVIADNGAGIEKEDLPHILERFYKGKNSGEDSVGIGLALAGMIVTKQEGTLKVENRKEGGARFRIRFYKGTL